jgi:hypothetical protein
MRTQPGPLAEPCWCYDSLLVQFGGNPLHETLWMSFAYVESGKEWHKICEI